MRAGFTVIGLWGLFGQVRAEQPSFRGAGTVPETSTQISAVKRDVLGIDDPNKDGWNSEVAARQVLEQLNLLLTGEDPEAVIGEGFRCTVLRPPALRQEFIDKTMSVHRAGVQPEPVAMKPADFPALWANSLPPSCAADSVRVKAKVINISAINDGLFQTKVRVEREGVSPSGPVFQSGHWQCGWRAGVRPEAPRLVSVAVLDFEECSRRKGELFTDRTVEVMHGDPSWTFQLSKGQPEWLRRMDAGITLQQFGHHGLAIGDVNGDGLEDVYVCQPAGLPNRLLLHQPGGTVKDIAAAAGVDWLEPSMSALLADLDNDGDADLAITAEQDVVVQKNDGHGNFSPPVIALSGHNFMGLSAADYDNDGDLDLYATAYYPNTAVPGRMAEPAPLHDANNGGQNAFLRNDSTAGALKFTDITRESGLDQNNTRWSFGAAWEDFDDDGDPDLTVVNDFGRLNFYRNDGGKFQDVAGETGLEHSAFGMSAAWADYDRDGRMDLYVAGMFTAAGSRIVPQQMFLQEEAGKRRDQFLVMTTGNALYHNAGGGKLADVSAGSGAQMGRWAWAAPFVDLNNDGWEDILITNGWLTNDRKDDL